MDRKPANPAAREFTCHLIVSRVMGLCLLGNKAPFCHLEFEDECSGFLQPCCFKLFKFVFGDPIIIFQSDTLRRIEQASTTMKTPAFPVTTGM